MIWATRSGVHIDRAASAWLIKKFIDQDATFTFVNDVADLADDTIPFDMRGVQFGHHGSDCTFETLLKTHDLADPAVWRIAHIVHEADLDDQRFDAPESVGLDVTLRGLSMVLSDQEVLDVAGHLFDGLYEFYRRELLLGREPS